MKFFIILSLMVLLPLCAQESLLKVDVKILLKETQSWDAIALPSYPVGEPEVTILKVIIPAHTKLPMHKHPNINAGVLLRGELTLVTDNNITRNIKAGDAVVETVNRWHYGFNESDEEVELIVFYAGIKDEPISILKN